MLQLARNSKNVKIITNLYKCNGSSLYSTQINNEESVIADDEEFRVLNLRETRQQFRRRVINRPPVNPPRTQQMAVDQDWGAVWPGPKTFNPASVPLPIRQGYTPKGIPPPGKFANAELMKIPNFLHLTPPVIQKQCAAIKKFCTAWPEGLETDEKVKEHLPVEIITSDYCHGLPTIRNPLSRIVSLRIPLSKLPLDQHAKDKFLRLVGDRYDAETDVVTILTDRCPLKQQNEDYAHYLLTALFHESWTVEPWESTKQEADMEVYHWHRNQSKKSTEEIVNWNLPDRPNKVAEGYIKSLETLINDGENEYNLKRYKEEVLNLLNLKKSVGIQPSP